MLVDFKDREELEAWLRTQKREVSVTLAARAALRVLPFLWTAHEKGFKGDIGAAIILPVFRATASAWVAARYAARDPAQADGLRAAAVGAGARAAAAAAGRAIAPDAARDAAASAAFTVAAEAARAATHATTATYQADSAATYAYAVTGAAFAADAQAIEGGLTAEELAGRKLWPEQQPREIAELWTQMKTHLLARGEDWDVWTDWYEDRLAGKSSNEALKIARVMIADEIWQQGPKVVNEEIKRLINEHEPPTPPPSNQGDRASFVVFADSLDAELIKHEQPTPPLEAIPEQARSATNFSLNARGLIDVLPDPPSDETLADPVQCDHYEETRLKTFALAELGPNQLGELTSPTNRFLASLPQDISDLSISRAWSRGNTLRSRLKAHDLSMNHDEPDQARLTPLAAESLRDLLSSWNVFIFGDSKGRELDERRLGPQEADSIRKANAASKALVDEIKHSENIATDPAIEAVVEQEQAALDAPPGIDGDQANDLSRKTTGNFIAQLLRAAYAPLSKLLKGSGKELEFASKEMRSGAYKNAGTAISTVGATIVATNWSHIASFVANHAEALKTFVMNNWVNPALLDIINLIARFTGH